MAVIGSAESVPPNALSATGHPSVTISGCAMARYDAWAEAWQFYFEESRKAREWHIEMQQAIERRHLQLIAFLTNSSIPA